jgi:hypothetical protein
MQQAQRPRGGTDGAAPTAGLVMDKEGNLYGITDFGGSHANRCCFARNYGTSLNTVPQRCPEAVSRMVSQNCRIR